MKRLAFLIAASPMPAFAAGEVFFSLRNSDFVVLIAFVLFIGVLIFFKVPSLLAGLLDKRAAGIQAELDEARKLREDAQKLLASYERKQAEVKDQAGRIVETAKKEAEEAAEKAKQDLDASIARRLQAAEDQIASAEAAAVRAVRDSALAAAFGGAADVVAAKTTAAQQSSLIDDAITEVAGKLQ